MNNLRGIFLMVAAMAGFALEDMFIKRASVKLPVGQILMILGAGGGATFATLTLRGGTRLWSRALLTGPVLLRNTGEVVGTTGFVLAVALIPISTASAILQATPLAVTLGAALFLDEKVGWRRWSAIAVGFVGVLVVIRPGMAGFEPDSLFAVLGVIGLSVRDLATRRCPRTVTTMQLSAYGFLLMIPVGGILLFFGDAPRPVGRLDMLGLGGAMVVGTLAYYALVEAVRIGDVSVVTPFRYSRLVFALIVGVVVFAERPDGLTLVGAGLIIGSGLYTFMRERRLVNAIRAA